jgi:maleate isomerase
MFGWRGCYGWVSPSTIQLPWELEAMLPEGVGVVATNLNVRAHQAAEFERAQQGIEAAVDVVVGEGAQAVVLAGVPLAVRQGFQREQDAHAAWSQRAGVPVTSGSAAAVAGLWALGARRPLVVTAYLDEFNELIVRYLGDAGLDVAAVAGLSVRSPAEASQTRPEAYFRLAKQLLLAHPESDSVFLGTRGNVMGVALQIEEDFGVPVVHSPQAGLWWALRHLRVAPRPGWGRLLSLPGR